MRNSHRTQNDWHRVVAENRRQKADLARLRSELSTVRKEWAVCHYERNTMRAELDGLKLFRLALAQMIREMCIHEHPTVR
jgi:hypothetical protein